MQAHEVLPVSAPLLTVTLLTFLIWKLRPDEQVQKKTWKQVSFRAYPYVLALALPLDEDKQRKALSTPSDIYAHYDQVQSKRIYTQISPTRGYTLFIYIM